LARFSWGNLLTNASTNIFIARLQVFLPGMFIFFALMSFNLLGDALRDAVDSRALPKPMYKS
jgi:peptide/nickel transport system permease protein